MTDTAKVVFVCLHGAAKSVVAAELFKRLAAEAGIPVTVAALGLQPDAEISPAAAAGLLAEGIDVRGQRPHAVTAQDLAGAPRVVAFGCAPDAVAPTDARVEQWADVPAVSDGYADARAAMAARLPRLLEHIRRVAVSTSAGTESA